MGEFQVQFLQQAWSDMAENLKAWHVCTSSAEKKFFVQSLLPLLPLFSYLHVALSYGVCALCTFLQLKYIFISGCKPGL